MENQLLQGYFEYTNSKKINYNLQQIEKSDTVIIIGSKLSNQNEEIQNTIKNIESTTNITYLHPMEETIINIKPNQFIKYEIGSEESVIAMILYHLLNTQQLDKYLKEYIEDIDIGYLSGESSVGEEEIEDIKLTSNTTLLIGEDLFNHKRAKNIGKLLGVMEENIKINIVSTAEISYSKKDNIQSQKLEELEELDTYNGTVIFFHKITKELNEEYLIGGEYFTKVAKIKDRDKIKITYNGITVNKEFKLDTTLRGVVGILPIQNEKEYSFQRVKIKKV